MRLTLLLPFMVLTYLTSLVSAAPITYVVTINTSSVAGTTGSLDINFNPGPMVVQAASLQILNLASNGMLTGNPTSTGDVSGMLPGTLTFNNGTAFNDYFQGFTYGSKLSFDMSLYGPALSSPDGSSTSGSTLAFSMFSDAAGTVPALTIDTTNGFAITVNVNLDGTTTVTNYSSQTTITSSSGPTAAPEPSSVALLAIATVMLLLIRSGNRIRSSL